MTTVECHEQRRRNDRSEAAPHRDLLEMGDLFAPTLGETLAAPIGSNPHIGVADTHLSPERGSRCPPGSLVDQRCRRCG